MNSRNDRLAEPPGGGRQDHDTMRAASSRLVSGPGSIDDLAAIGGLAVPAHEAHPELAPCPPDCTREPIPGEYDSTTLTRREPGAVGGGFAGADTPSPDPHWVDDRTARDHAREGGGR